MDKKFTKKFNKFNLAILINLMLIFNDLCASSVIYSMKIRRIASARVEGTKDTAKNACGISIDPVVRIERDHIVDPTSLLLSNVRFKQILGGAMLTFKYLHDKKWWFDITTAVGTESGQARGSLSYNAKRTGFDDILFSTGFNFNPNKDTQLVVYAMAGFPTKYCVNLGDTINPMLGTRFYNVGGGIEFTYDFINTDTTIAGVLVQARTIHFFTRKWFPILSENGRIQPGNLSDIVVTFRYRKTLNIFEVGYDATIFSNQAVIDLGEKIKGSNFVLNGIYGTFHHIIEKFPILNKTVIISFGCAGAVSKRYHIRIFESLVGFAVRF